tara:strand:+ start:968 stop:2176 length:1209 start_codon:yes stop_codon:yes gene_type:complete
MTQTFHSKINLLSDDRYYDLFANLNQWGINHDEICAIIGDSPVQEYIIKSHPYWLPGLNGSATYETDPQTEYFKNYADSIETHWDSIRAGDTRLVFLLQDWWTTMNEQEKAHSPNMEGEFTSLDLYNTLYHSLKARDLLAGSRFVCGSSIQGVVQHTDWPIYDYNEPFLRWSMLKNYPVETATSFRKHFLWLNRRLRTHRVLALHEAYKHQLLQHCTYTAHEWSELDETFYEDTIRAYTDEVDMSFAEFNGRQYIGDSYDVSTDVQYVPEALATRNASADCFAEIVTEFNYSDNKVYLTEKIARAIVNKKPFLIIGDRNSLKELQRMGFRTFNNFWGESYDTQPGIYNRIKKVMYQLQNIVQTIDLNQPYTDEMHSVLEHNYRHFFGAFTDQQNKKLESIFA